VTPSGGRGHVALGKGCGGWGWGGVFCETRRTGMGKVSRDTKQKAYTETSSAGNYDRAIMRGGREKTANKARGAGAGGTYRKGELGEGSGRPVSEVSLRENKQKKKKKGVKRGVCPSR